MALPFTPVAILLATALAGTIVFAHGQQAPARPTGAVPGVAARLAV
ncbi:hypothetical protein [Hymenobacter sp.]